MGKKNKKDKKTGKSRTQNASFTGSKSSSYSAVPLGGSGSDSSISNTPAPPLSKQPSKSAAPERKPSPVLAPLSTLNNDEYEFFSMVSSGDIQGVSKYLSSPEFERRNKNINRFDRRGYTALHMAVRRQDEEMINILLKTPNIQLYDIILHAIREDNLEITKLLLKINDKLMRESGRLPNTTNQNDDDDEEENGDKAISINLQSGIWTSLPIPINGVNQTSATGLTDSQRQSSASSSIRPVTSAPSNTKKDYRDEIPFDSEFHDVITALMLAAQFGSTQLIELFYNRGERLETLEFTHNIGCKCNICEKIDGDGDMSRVHQRYHLHKAICQPEYICMMAQKIKVDPVNYAIDKIVKLRDIMNRDKAYDQMYAEFIEELEKFCTDMMSMCRSTKETKVFLSPKDTLEKERLPHLNPRLWYTVGLDMKSFVAHSNTQNVVYHMWASDPWPEWESYGTIYRLFQLAIRVVAFPLIAIILMVADGTKLGITLASPIGRFLNYVASYVIFLILVGFQVAYPYQRCNQVEPYYNTHDDNCKTKGPPTIGTEWPIIIYILSFCASMLKRQSMKGFYIMKWNWYDVVFVLSFICVFLCWGYAWIWTQIPENEPFISISERKFWGPYTPEVLGECFLAIATMLAFGRLLRFLQLFSNLGPLQVILGTQITAYFSTAFMFFIVLFAFGSALLCLYVPYGDYYGLDDHKKHKKQDDDFSSVKSIIPHLFNHLGDPGPGGELLTWDIPINETTVKEVHHMATQTTGKLILVAYQFIGVLMMYNMLTGYFGQTMGTVLQDSDRVWKFTRTELYLTHLKDTVLPPPFNLIPTLKTFGDAMKFFTLIGKRDDPKAACSFRQCCYITGSKKTKEWKELNEQYRPLILEIVFRYYRFRKETQEKEQATRDDVLEIGEEITELKEKLRIDGKVGNQDDDDDSDDDDFNDFTRRNRSQWRNKWEKPGEAVQREIRIKNIRSGATGQGNSPAPANPVITSQPRGSPQAGPSGNTTFNTSPVTKPPPVPSTPPSGQPTTRSSFSKPSSPPMNIGVVGSAPTMQMNPTIQMASYQTPPKGNQASYTMVRTDSSSLMNAPTIPKTPSPPTKTNSKGDLNRNESDSLYGSTTVANVAYYNNYDDRFPRDDSALKKYPPSIFQEKEISFKGRPGNSDTWDQSPSQKFPPPIVRETLKERADDFGGTSIKPPTKANPRDSSTWDKSPLLTLPPPIVRKNLKQNTNDLGEYLKPKPNPRDSSTWDKTPLLNYPPPIVRENLKDKVDDFGTPNPGSSGSNSFTEATPRDSDTWDESVLEKHPFPYFRGNFKQN